MCVYALLKHLRGSFSHLDWLGFIPDRKKKRFQTGLLSILEGGISPFFFPFFLFFHFHSSIFPNSPIPSNQFQFNRVVSLLRVNVHLTLSSNSSSRGVSSSLHQKSRHSSSKIAINYRRLFFFLKKYFSLFSFESLNRSPKSNHLLFSRNGCFFLELSSRFLDREIEKKEEHDFLPSKL